MCVSAHDMSWHMCRGWRTALWSRTSPSTLMWLLEIQAGGLGKHESPSRPMTTLIPPPPPLHVCLCDAGTHVAWGTCGSQKTPFRRGSILPPQFLGITCSCLAQVGKPLPVELSLWGLKGRCVRYVIQREERVSVKRMHSSKGFIYTGYRREGWFNPQLICHCNSPVCDVYLWAVPL